MAKVIKCYVLSKVEDHYESFISVVVDRVIYNARRVHPSIMVEGTYMSEGSQRDYVLYDLVNEVNNLIREDILREAKKKLGG